MTECVVDSLCLLTEGLLSALNHLSAVYAIVRDVVKVLYWCVTYDLKLDTFYEIYVLKLDSG